MRKCGNGNSCCFLGSFVSVIHLAVGVVYCLGSWTVGLPKRAVSALFQLYGLQLLHGLSEIVNLWTYIYSCSRNTLTN